MKIYFAPLEGVTGYIYRNAYDKFYGKGKIDKYFIPFISPNKTNGYTAREVRDMNPDNNRGIPVAVQIMTNRADYFLKTVEMLYEKGYDEVNLNLGCPSGTVVAKHRGAGFLAVPDMLEEFFEEVFENTLISSKTVKVSVKTRLGISEAQEFERLLGIFNDYPLSEVIIHPRVQKDYYKNSPNMEAFREAVNNSRNPVCYNGNIFTFKDYENFCREFPNVERIMLGRGLIADPGLINAVYAFESAQPMQRQTQQEQQLLKQFHDTIYREYLAIMSGDKNVIHKMKELWFYQRQTFDNSEKAFKLIKKSQRMCDYEAAVSQLFLQAQFCVREHMSF